MKDHGFWVGYTPVAHPEDAPRGAAFCRRESDGFDWYEYVNVEVDNKAHEGRVKQFAPKTVKCVVEVLVTPHTRATVDSAVVRAAAVDETRLFPQDCQLIELDIERPQDEAALIEEFANRRINLMTGEVGERWTPPPLPIPPPSPFEKQMVEALAAINDRLKKLEGP